MDIATRLVADTKKLADGCWVWTGYIRPDGYGEVCFKRHRYLVHRAAYELAYGPIPEGLSICHTCDVRPCLNPVHLFAGTAADNAHDMIAKGRNRYKPHKGEKNGRAKLTDDDVRLIRATYARGGVTIDELAAEYGITSTNMKFAIRGKTWPHIEGAIPLGLSRRSVSGPLLIARYPDPSLTHEQRQCLYIRERHADGASIPDIGNELGLSRWRAYAVTRIAGIYVKGKYAPRTAKNPVAV